jgi:hypothetical protein
MDYIESINIIKKWAEYGKCIQELNYNNAFNGAEKIDRMFQPFGVQEPFFMDLSNNRLFLNAREENYSDYLAWLLDQVSENKEWLIRQFLKISECELNNIDLKDKKPTIAREFPVKEGYEGQSGRIDILILYETEKVLIDVEVKITDADSVIEELKKNNGYRKSLEAIYPKDKYKHFHRLLATEAKEENYNNESKDKTEWYYPIEWHEVCYSLRQLVLSGVLKNKILLKALIVSFAGIVEQSLLGYWSLGNQDKQKFIDEKSSEYINTLSDNLDKWRKSNA